MKAELDAVRALARQLARVDVHRVGRMRAAIAGADDSPGSLRDILGMGSFDDLETLAPGGRSLSDETINGDGLFGSPAPLPAKKATTAARRKPSTKANGSPVAKSDNETKRTPSPSRDPAPSTPAKPAVISSPSKPAPSPTRSPAPASTKKQSNAEPSPDKASRDAAIAAKLSARARAKEYSARLEESLKPNIPSIAAAVDSAPTTRSDVPSRENGARESLVPGRPEWVASSFHQVCLHLTQLDSKLFPRRIRQRTHRIHQT